MTKLNKEYRTALNVTVPDSEDFILEGTAIVLDTEVFIGVGDKGFYEKISSSAFDNIDLSRADVFMRYNHESSPLILARTRNKTLQLFKTNNGIQFRAKLQPDIQQHRDIYNSIKAGLITSMSFGIIVDDGGEVITRDKNGYIHREIIKVTDLFEISVVDDPAYKQTNVIARSLESMESDLIKLDNLAKLESDKLKLAKEKIKIKLNLI